MKIKTHNFIFIIYYIELIYLIWDLDMMYI